MQTEKLIRQLARSAEPVRPIASPSRRLAAWLLIAIPFMVMVVLIMSPRPDLVERLADPRYLAEQGLALLTALSAAVAAFAMVVPGMSPRWRLLPVVPAVMWLATLGAGCLADWRRLGTEALRLTQDAECLLYISLIGSVPALFMLWMLRRGAPLRPGRTALMGALAAAGLGAFGLRLFHDEDLGMMVLVWQVGSVMLLAGAGWLAGPWILRWRHREARA